MNEKPQCQSCIYAGLRDADPTRLGQPRAFDCRRFPPGLVATQHGPVSAWPPVAADGWCGEFIRSDRDGDA